MKARVKATKEIVEVDLPFISASEEIVYARVGSAQVYAQDELDFDVQGEDIIDYWEKLHHQYAGMAMQGMLNNSYLAGEFRRDPNNGIEDMSKIITKAAVIYATALVEKLKNE